MENLPPQSSAPVILMNGVVAGSLQDPTSVVLSEVDWTVNSGDFWALAGLQGSGKSDFLMLTAGMMPPVSGRYFFFGQEMPIFDESRLPERLRLGFVFENGQLFNHLTIRENLALPLRYHQNLTAPDAADAVQTMLEATELAPWADITPGALGRNWQKRIGLARALMLKPEVVLLDNPLAGLDLRHVYWWLGFLERLSKPHNLVRNEPLTLVVTISDLQPWLGLARQFAIVKNQRLTILGERDQLEAAGDELVAELLTLQPRNG
jgi:ABC-type transporter Mla maintaining outer membrane lipid asymmetry ATPase subunit MlaF